VRLLAESANINSDRNSAIELEKRGNGGIENHYLACEEED